MYTGLMEIIRSRAHRLPQVTNRAIHLVDAENLSGSTSFTVAQAIAVQRSYLALVSPGPVDQFVLATSHFAALTAWFAWPHSTRRLVQSGPDGADLALLDVIEHERVGERFGRVVIGSGDGIFALPAAQLQAAGCAVTVVSRRRGLSRALQLAVRDVRFIDPPYAPAFAPACRGVAA